MVAYLDTSVLLEHILKGDEGIRQVLSCDSVIASELLEVECRRVIHRYRLEGLLGDDGFISAVDRLDNVLNGISLIRLSSEVLVRAGQAFPVSIKMFDALHLSSALIYKSVLPEEILLVYSYDSAFNRCAKALELPVPFLT